MTFRVVGVEETEVGHELATVADAEAERVRTVVEAVDGRASTVVIEYACRPALGRSEDVGVGKTAAEDGKIDVVECLAARGEVGQVDVLHVEPGQIEGVGHFALAVRAFIAEDGRTDAAPFGAGGGESEAGGRSDECVRDTETQRLHLILFVTGSCALLAALKTVEQVGGAIPDVAHIIDAEVVISAVLRDEQVALVSRASHAIETYARLAKDGLQTVVCGHLQEYGGVFGEEDLDQIGVGDGVQIDLEAAVNVSKTHLQ